MKTIEIELSDKTRATVKCFHVCNDWAVTEHYDGVGFVLTHLPTTFRLQWVFPDEEKAIKACGKIARLKSLPKAIQEYAETGRNLAVVNHVGAICERFEASKKPSGLCKETKRANLRNRLSNATDELNALTAPAGVDTNTLKPVSESLRDIAKALEAQVNALERIASHQDEMKDGIGHLCQVGNAILECLEEQSPSQKEE